MTIELQYIKESDRIIKSYKLLINDLNKISQDLEVNKKELVKLQENIERLKKSKEPDLQRRSELTHIMNEYDKQINSMEKIIQPKLEKLEEIKKESKNLYDILHQKYPGLTDKQLQEQIFKQLDELN